MPPPTGWSSTSTRQPSNSASTTYATGSPPPPWPTARSPHSSVPGSPGAPAPKHRGPRRPGPQLTRSRARRQVLVPRTVVALVTGSGPVLDARTEHELKAFLAPVGSSPSDDLLTADPA